MISIKKNFLFIHVPKTAGNSIQTILKEYSEDKIVTNIKQDGVGRFGVINKKYGTKKHSRLLYYKRKIEPEIYNKLFKFAVIRNPWDRMISWFLSPHREVKEWNRDEFYKFAKQKPTIKKFIALPSNHTKLDGDIDFLLCYEHLGEDFKKLCKIIDIPFKIPPKINMSQSKHDSHYYDEELKELIRNKFQEEIVYGEYEFQYE